MCGFFLLKICCTLIGTLTYTRNQSTADSIPSWFNKQKINGATKIKGSRKAENKFNTIPKHNTYQEGNF